MRDILFNLRVTCLLFLTCLATIPAISHAALGIEGKLELWFEHNGRQANLTQAPGIRCVRQSDGKDIACNLYRGDDGRYWIDRPADGSYILYATARDDVTDYYRAYSFKVDATTTGPLLVALNRSIPLLQTGADKRSASGITNNCRDYDRFSVSILALFSQAQLNLEWQPLVNADHYRYKIWRVRCADDKPMEPVVLGSVETNRLSEYLPTNAADEYYRLELYASHGNQNIGQLLLIANGEIQNDAYPFVVTDALGSRSWLPYVLLLLPVPVLLWLLLWLLRGTAVLIRVPGKGFAWTLLIGLLATGGYLQRQELMQWTQQISQKWYRSPTDNDGYTAEARSFNADEWYGVLVSADNEPFYGDRRRLDIRVVFHGDTARFSVLQDGHWREITGDAFTISRSGSGMTLFGHRRDGLERELWSVSIADLSEPSLRLVLDRLITTRRSANGQVQSIRRRATGELHHGLR